MKISPLSSYSAKSGHLAFRGITYEPVKKTSYGYRYVEIFGVNMNDIKGDVYYGNRTLDQNIQLYNEKIDANRKFVKTKNDKSSLFYIADPNEVVPDEKFKEHGYIVYDTEPPFPTSEQIESKFTCTSADSHDYFKDLRQYIQYQKRVINLEAENISKIVDEIKNSNKTDDNNNVSSNPFGSLSYSPKMLRKITDSEAKIEKATIKAERASKLFDILSESKEDFELRDMIAGKIRYIEDNYADIDTKLKDVETKKYIVDENIEKIKKELSAVRKREDEERERCGPSYNQSYPPSPTYYHRVSIENRFKDAVNESTKLQELYNEYSDIKYNGIEKKRELEMELYNIVDKMTNKFHMLEIEYVD